MIEHRLIERMIAIMKRDLHGLEAGNTTSVSRIDIMVDFIRTYADRCHHGKEEDILFRELDRKNLTVEHRKIMDELIQEHIHGRNTVKKLVAARKKYEMGDGDALSDIRECFLELTDFYPRHIDKEDNHFFMPCMRYFSQDEKDALLDESWAFDRSLIHEKYKDVVESIE